MVHARVSLEGETRERERERERERRRKIVGWGLIELWYCVFLWRIYTDER
jgi:hypothetical protein